MLRIWVLALGLGAVAYAESGDLSVFPEYTELTTIFHINQHAASGDVREVAKAACQSEMEAAAKRVRHARVLATSCDPTVLNSLGYGAFHFGRVHLKVWLEGPLVATPRPFAPPQEGSTSFSWVNYNRGVSYQRERGERDPGYVFYTWDSFGDDWKGQHGTLWTLKKN